MHLNIKNDGATCLEATIVADMDHDPVSTRLYDSLVIRHLVIEPFTEEQAQTARQAYRDFGRGSGHPAKLNFGDCFAYALAKCVDEPLLFKGNDFSQTDLVPVELQDVVEDDEG